MTLAIAGQSYLNIEWEFFKWNKNVQFFKSSEVKIKNRQDFIYECDFLDSPSLVHIFYITFFL